MSNKIRKSWISGHTLCDVIELLDSIEEEKVYQFDEKFRSGLLDLGYTVKEKFIVDNRGDGYRGKIDFVIEKRGKRAAIQLDNIHVRHKNIRKIKEVPKVDMRLVYCRFA